MGENKTEQNKKGKETEKETEQEQEQSKLREKERLHVSKAASLQSGWERLIGCGV